MKSLINLNLGKIGVKNLLKKCFDLKDCYVFKQIDHTVLIIVVLYNKPYILKSIQQNSKQIEKYIGKFKYKIEEDDSFVSVNRLVSNFKETLKSKRFSVPSFMKKLSFFLMGKSNIKGVIILIRGVIFGARKSKSKLAVGKQKYTGSYIKNYSDVIKDTLQIPKGVSGLTIKIFYNTPAKYDLKSYLEERKKRI